MSGSGPTPHGLPASTRRATKRWAISFRDDDLTDEAHRDVSTAGGRLELFDYAGDGHLFTDPTRPDEYDAEATELLWSRVLPFVQVSGSQVS